MAGYAFSGTTAAASISWRWYQFTHTIGTTSYAIGHAFEEWYYKAYNVLVKQARAVGVRFDAIVNGTIVELKNYDWSKYSNYTGLINRFVDQARRYQTFFGKNIDGQTISKLMFVFSSKPPQEIVVALERLGVIVKWLR